LSLEWVWLSKTLFDKVYTLFGRANNPKETIFCTYELH
jgi:hypothetical protein